MTSVTPPSGPTTTYSWDWRNKLISIDQGETNIAQFEYDGDGNRTAATFGSETTSFLYDGGQVIAELDGQGALKAFYVLGADGAISRLAAAPAYYHGDGLWSVKAMSDGSMGVTDAYAYDAWGNGLAHFGTAQQPYQYVGQLGYYAHYQNPAFGLFQLGARYYEPGIGRFITRDPAKDGMNWYAYAENDPVMVVDQTGLWSSGGPGAIWEDGPPQEHPVFTGIPYGWNPFGPMPRYDPCDPHGRRDCITNCMMTFGPHFLGGGATIARGCFLFPPPYSLICAAAVGLGTIASLHSFCAAWCDGNDPALPPAGSRAPGQPFVPPAPTPPPIYGR